MAKKGEGGQKGLCTLLKSTSSGPWAARFDKAEDFRHMRQNIRDKTNEKEYQKKFNGCFPFSYNSNFIGAPRNGEGRYVRKYVYTVSRFPRYLIRSLLVSHLSE